MAKRKQADVDAPQADGETISGYFRRVFKERPDLLKSRSNAEVLERWLQDHPGETRVPDRVKTNLANIKSVLRAKARRRGRKAKAAEAPGEAPAAAPARAVPEGLEALEVQIDDALTLARTLDREGLESVIGHLRRARNEVVWKLGQPE
jgi:hypothetical protein